MLHHLRLILPIISDITDANAMQGVWCIFCDCCFLSSWGLSMSSTSSCASWSTVLSHLSNPFFAHSVQHSAIAHTPQKSGINSVNCPHPPTQSRGEEEDSFPVHYVVDG